MPMEHSTSKVVPKCPSNITTLVGHFLCEIYVHHCLTNPLTLEDDELASKYLLTLVPPFDKYFTSSNSAILCFCEALTSPKDSKI